jgi:catechol 2,3-dioxygenase-like lactoylglutathione lyase family enzyme
MRADGIDHVNLVIPEDGIDEAVAFYDDLLGFETENLETWRAGETAIFSFRLTPESIIHISPREDFHPPTRDNYWHLAIRVAADLDDVVATLEAAGYDPEEKGELLGATGEARAIYVADPFGYTVELKETT